MIPYLEIQGFRLHPFRMPQGKEVLIQQGKHSDNEAGKSISSSATELYYCHKHISRHLELLSDPEVTSIDGLCHINTSQPAIF